jgi:hypothetical protein
MAVYISTNNHVFFDHKKPNIRQGFTADQNGRQANHFTARSYIENIMFFNVFLVGLASQVHDDVPKAAADGDLL